MKEKLSYPGCRLKTRSWDIPNGIVVQSPEDHEVVCHECLKVYDEREEHECEKLSFLKKSLPRGKV